MLTVLSVSEVAEYLGVGKNRVYELLNTGKLNGFRMGSTWKISRMALENYILNASEALNSDKKKTCGTVALSNIFCWAAALLYAQMGAKSVVISPPSLINTVHSQTSLSACLISNCFVFNH
ncbi:MAG: helix-turn-helix domain-containing protein [Ruminococcus sp.]